MTTDAELLQHYAATHAEAAFAELVQRHVNLVYSAALRQVNGDAHLAQDVAQTVFTDLARKAGSLARRETLTGWLYTSAHFAAAKLVRGENRRRDREEKFMREPTSETAPELDWEKLRPTLDAAMHELKDADREAILLRYFENRPFAEVGAKLGLNENAARMRVERSLEKLRTILGRRGVAVTAALASAISANAVQLAPANLAATLTAASIATAGTGTFTILKIMTMTKIKVAFSALAVAGATTALMVQHQTQTKLGAENQSLRQQMAQLQSDNESLSNQVSVSSHSAALSKEQFNELLKLRGEIAFLRRQASEPSKLKDENQQLKTQVEQLATVTQNQMFEAHEARIINSMEQLGIAMRVYSSNHANQYATNFDQLAYSLPSGFPGENMKLTDFEFINPGLVTESHPQMVMFREFNPRQTPDKQKWHRSYVFADGSVQAATSDDGNFDAWEKQNTEVPPPNQ